MGHASPRGLPPDARHPCGRELAPQQHPPQGGRRLPTAQRLPWPAEDPRQRPGPGSAGAKAQHLRDLFGRATAGEQEFLIRLLFGELRQGALEGVLVEAITVSADGNTFTSTIRYELLDQAGKPVAGGGLGESHAARMTFDTNID